MKEYYLINEVSKITEIPVSTLRYYSTENLITPAFKDKNNNYNYYSLEQIFNLKLINYIRNLGISLEQIKEYVLNKGEDNLEKILKEIISEIQNKIINLKMQKKIIEKHLINYKVSKNVELNIPFIKEFEDIKGIEISSDKKVFQKFSLKFDYKYFGLKFSKNDSQEDIIGSHLYISFKNKDNKAIIANNGNYVCIQSESFFRRDDILENIRKVQKWSESQKILISEDAFVFFEEEYTLFKENSKAKYIIMLPINKERDN